MLYRGNWYRDGKYKCPRCGEMTFRGESLIIDLIIEENGTLYPIEIKMSATPKSEMAKANDILDKIEGKNRGIGVILCQCDKKVYLRDNLIALPIEYI